MKFAQNIGMAPRQSATESLDGSRRDTLPQFGKPASSRREPRHEHCVVRGTHWDTSQRNVSGAYVFLDLVL